MALNFPFENLNEDDFEDMTIRICNELLGIAVKNFTKGPDGAKDGWFEGTAERYPSSTEPWGGKFNIQAKHTTTVNASCSDPKFSSKKNKNAVLTKELSRLKEVIKENPFQCYLMFTNRKFSGGNMNLVERIKLELGISFADLIGSEQIGRYLDDHPFIAHRYRLTKYEDPLRFYEKDIQEVILAFHDQIKGISKTAENFNDTLAAVDLKTKNDLNKLSEEYFSFIKDHSMGYFKEIDNFLKDPKNSKYCNYYENTVSDLQASITLKRNNYGEFQELIEYLCDYIVSNDRDKLLALRKIVRVFIHFMYFNCDIGKKE